MCVLEPHATLTSENDMRQPMIKGRSSLKPWYVGAALPPLTKSEVLVCDSVACGANGYLVRLASERW